MQQRPSVKSAAAQQSTRHKLKETAMDVRGYPTGPIDAKGAFTSEIDLSPKIKPGPAQHRRRGGPPASRRPAGHAPQISAAASRSGDRSHILIPVPPL